MNTEQPFSSLAEEAAVTPDAVAYLMFLGHSFFQQGKLNEARDIFQGIVLLDASNPYAHAILGSIHQQQNQLEEAIDCFGRALKLHATDINTLTNRGECFLNLGLLEEAAQHFKAAILLDSEENNQAANRARFLASVTLEALRLAEAGGQQAVVEAKRRLDQQLNKS